jgi:hypothetical protein
MARLLAGKRRRGKTAKGARDHTSVDGEVGGRLNLELEKLEDRVGGKEREAGARASD